MSFWDHPQKPKAALKIDEIRGENKEAKVNIARYKGLGEMNPEQLCETTMDPETRTLLKVTANDFTDEGETSALFMTLMGEDVSERRAFIEKYAAEVTNLDV